MVSFVLILCPLLLEGVVRGEFNNFMDSVYFNIEWPGPLNPSAGTSSLDESTASLSENEDAVVVTTTNNERYRCLLPRLEEEQNKADAGVSSFFVELELLRPLFHQTSCTYRLETYWTYELCHGRHLRQYHEEKEAGKSAKIQEFYLGRYQIESFSDDLKAAKEKQQNPDTDQGHGHKVKKVQGVEIPYYEVQYVDGTSCDLTGAPRRVALHFVCQPDGRGEIYELKETSSCEYEAVVLTSLLCSHPIYGPKKEPINTIHCHSLSQSPRRPRNLDLLELENTAGRYNSKQSLGLANDAAAAAMDAAKDSKDQLATTMWDALTSLMDRATAGLQDADDDDDEDDDFDEGGTPPVRHRPGRTGGGADHSAAASLRPSTDRQILKDFLEGKHCIQGGTGWWRHEFCYGRHVTQYHEDPATGKIVIVLGEWNTAAHLEWIVNNPRKQPQRAPDGRKSLTHIYANGDICAVTGLRRFVEVRLKCMENPSHPNLIALYLLEPKPCEYKLVVESQLLCSVIDQADGHGIIDNPRL